jgi:hypothetical protein
MDTEGPTALERSLLRHLLKHRGHQVRFEADQWTTEFGIFRAFFQEDQSLLKNALRTLEMSRLIYRRVQYVIGYSEPKLVYSLTATGHRKALDLQRREEGAAPDGMDGPEGTIVPAGVTGPPNPRLGAGDA